jgi:hypothetical protein
MVIQIEYGSVKKIYIAISDDYYDTCSERCGYIVPLEGKEFSHRCELFNTVMDKMLRCNSCLKSKEI